MTRGAGSEAEAEADLGTGGVGEGEALGESRTPEAEERGQEVGQEGEIPLSTPSISMSAGADPWADPPIAARDMNGTISATRRPGGSENPWAFNTPDLGKSGDPEEKLGANALSANQHGGGTGGYRIEASSTTSQSNERWGEYHLPKLGHAMARYWTFKPGLLQLNSGSYGACPRPVCEAYKALQDRQEENCDVCEPIAAAAQAPLSTFPLTHIHLFAPNIQLFRTSQLPDLMREGRSKVARILNCQTENVVLIANSTTGTNAVLRDMIFQDGDAILVLSLTYGGVQKTIDWLIDTEAMRGVCLHRVVVELDMPLERGEIVKELRKTIEQVKKDQGLNIKVGIIDTISSKPAIRLPWEEMIQVLREHQILSIVDGAHGIGQIKIDLTSADPDFFVSNCHKWLYVHRACAVLYVAPRNVHLQRSGLPTSHSYMRKPSLEVNTWVKQWLDPGTLDVSAFLTIDAAIEFRQMLGGEERIQDYNNDLALRGGLAAAKILNTCLLDNGSNSLTASMVNVQLPVIKSRIGNDLDTWAAAAVPWFFDSLLQEFKLVLPTFAYRGKFWARFSAQVWLEVSDFEYAARALLELCNRINQGSAPKFASTATAKTG